MCVCVCKEREYAFRRGGRRRCRPRRMVHVPSSETATSLGSPPPLPVKRATQGHSWEYSKVNLHQVCLLLTTIFHKMAPRTGNSGAGITPRRAFCGSPRHCSGEDFTPFTLIWIAISTRLVEMDRFPKAPVAVTLFGCFEEQFLVKPSVFSRCLGLWCCQYFV